MSRSVAKNALFSGIKTISSMIFPLITYPYATRVLLAENLGKVDFTTAVISYFSLIAGLGIANYATREGAGLRQDDEEISEFASQVFTINVTSTIISYVLLIAIFCLWPRLRSYGVLVAVQALIVMGNTLGVEWVYTIFEDYGYITLRSIVVQIVSAVLLFTLVKHPSDYLIYASIIVFSNVGANIFNFIHARRYVRIRIVRSFDALRHLAPMLVLFGNAIAVTIYVNTDVTLLGIFQSNHAVGIYGVAVRVYTIVKQLLNSVVNVSLPRLSLYCAKQQEAEYQALLHSVIHGLIVTALPILCILFLMSDYVVFIIGGMEFSDSATPLKILCFAAIPAIFATLEAYAILLPHKVEKYVLKSTVVGAVVNLTLNLVAIPLFGYNGAALTTAIAELSVCVTAFHFARPFLKTHDFASRIVPPLLTALLCVCCMTCGYVALQYVVPFSIAGFFMSGILLATIYLVVLIARKDDYAMDMVRLLRTRLLVNRSGGNS